MPAENTPNVNVYYAKDLTPEQIAILGIAVMSVSSHQRSSLGRDSAKKLALTDVIGLAARNNCDKIVVHRMDSRHGLDPLYAGHADCEADLYRSRTVH